MQRINATKPAAPMVMEIETVQVEQPQTPYAVFQWIGQQSKRWCEIVTFSQSSLDWHIANAKKDRTPYRVTRLHFESGEAREVREREEAHWQAEKRELDNE